MKTKVKKRSKNIVGNKVRVRKGGKTFLRALPGEGKDEPLKGRKRGNMATKIAAIGLLSATGVGAAAVALKKHSAEVEKKTKAKIEEMKEQAKEQAAALIMQNSPNSRQYSRILSKNRGEKAKWEDLSALDRAGRIVGSNVSRKIGGDLATNLGINVGGAVGRLPGGLAGGLAGFGGYKKYGKSKIENAFISPEDRAKFSRAEKIIDFASNPLTITLAGTAVGAVQAVNSLNHKVEDAMTVQDIHRFEQEFSHMSNQERLDYLEKTAKEEDIASRGIKDPGLKSYYNNLKKQRNRMIGFYKRHSGVVDAEFVD